MQKLAHHWFTVKCHPHPYLLVPETLVVIQILFLTLLRPSANSPVGQGHSVLALYSLVFLTQLFLTSPAVFYHVLFLPSRVQ